jgi:hypothetical protein
VVSAQIQLPGTDIGSQKSGVVARSRGGVVGCGGWRVGGGTRTGESWKSFADVGDGSKDLIDSG